MRNLNLREIVGIVSRMMTRGRLLKRTPFWPAEKLREWQFSRLQELVRHAYVTIPFYAEHYKATGFEPGDLKTWDDFHKLPCVSKDQVIGNYPQRMLKSGYVLDDLIVSRSSGSSGKVLDIAYDSDAMIWYVLAGLRLYKMCFSYRPWHKQVYVYTSPYPMNSLLGCFPLQFVSTLTPTAEILATLKRSRADLLVCYPSHLKQILQNVPENERRKIRPKAVSVNSEMSTQAERDYLSELLGCPVLDEYSSEELTRIAAQCTHKTYHLFEDVNYMETLDADGRKTEDAGVIVGTNLHNFAMPMIRYQQNDLGKIENSECPCGWKFRRLVGFQGRRNDSFEMPSGKILSSGFLLDATYEFLLAYRTAVKDFCLIQRTRTAVALQIIPGEGWNDDVKQKIAARFHEFLEASMEFQIQIVPECEKTKTGKRNPIINLMNRCDTRK